MDHHGCSSRNIERVDTWCHGDSDALVQAFDSAWREALRLRSDDHSYAPRPRRLIDRLGIRVGHGTHARKPPLCPQTIQVGRPVAAPAPWHAEHVPRRKAHGPPIERIVTPGAEQNRVRPESRRHSEQHAHVVGMRDVFENEDGQG